MDVTKLPVEYVITTTSDWTVLELINGGFWSDFNEECTEGNEKLTNLLHGRNKIIIQKNNGDASRVVVTINCVLNLVGGRTQSYVNFKLTKGDLGCTEIRIKTAGVENQLIVHSTEGSDNKENPLVFNSSVRQYLMQQGDISSKITKIKTNKVFIVHGREHTIVKELKEMLIGFGLESVVLYDQPGASITTVEKLEKYSDVGYAIVLLTPDDVGGLRAEMRKRLGGDTPLFSREITVLGGGVTDRILNIFESRARQNVILEFGYFINKLGRENVCCLYQEGMELPSDMSGIEPISFKESIAEVKEKIIGELEAASFELKKC